MIQRDGDARAARARAPRGAAVRHDIDVYLQGINAQAEGGRRHAAVDARRRLRRQRDHRPDLRPGRRRRGAPLGVPSTAAQARTERTRGTRSSTTFSEFDDPDSPTTISTHVPVRARRSAPGEGNAVLDAGSFKPTGPQRPRPRRRRAPALGEQLPAGRRRALGHRPPAVRRRPADRLHVPGPDARGRHQLARRAGARRDGAGLRRQHPDRPRAGLRVEPHVGGLGPDRHYVETLCGGSRTKYRYKGRCRTMGRVDAGTIAGLRARRLPHDRARPGDRLREGRAAAPSRVSRKRASYGQRHPVAARVPRPDGRQGAARPRRSATAMATSPFTFNVGYADDRDIAMYSAGQLPVRDPRRRPAAARPRAPASTSGRASSRRPSTRTRTTRRAGMLVNWNNRPAPGWGAADDNWAYGSAQRVRMLLDGLAKRDKHDLATVTRAMNAAATQDLRSVALTPVLQSSADAPRRRRARGRRGCSTLLEAWRAAGSSRLDRDLDGVMDAGPGPAIWDAFYPRLFDGGDAGRPGLDDVHRHRSRPAQRLHRRRLLVPREGPAAAQRGAGSRRRSTRATAATATGRRARAAVWAALEAVPGRPGRAARRRDARSGSRSGPGCCRPRSATRTARAASSR